MIPAHPCSSASVHCDSASEMMAEALRWVPPKQALEPAHDTCIVDSAGGSERDSYDGGDYASSACDSTDGPSFTALPTSPVHVPSESTRL